MLKCVVFDFDGTLVDSKAVFVSIYNSIARKKGYAIMETGNIDHLRSMSIPERCAFLKIPMFHIPFIASRFIREYKNSLPLLEFNAGIKEMLEELTSTGINYAVLSSNSSKNIFEYFQLQSVNVTDIYCSSNIFGKDKVLKKFLRAKSLKPSEILYVGDEARDIIACKKLGVAVAWVSWGYDSIDAIKDLEPEYIIHEPSALLQLIHDLS